MQGFKSPHSRTFTLMHEEERLDLRIHALPFAYREALKALMPEPEGGSPAWNLRIMFLILARGLGSQLSATPPEAGAGAEAWEAFADSVQAECTAALFTEHDLTLLLDAIMGLQQGTTPKS